MSSQSILVPYKRNPIDQEMKDSVLKYLDQGETLQNRFEQVICFEKEFATYCGRKYAVGLNSATSALYLTLLACGITRGDEVIIPPNSFASVGNSVLTTGATPVFVDVEDEIFNIAADKFEEKITKKTKAVIPVAHCGHPCDMDHIMEIANKHNLHVIENLSAAGGAKYKGRKVPVGHAGIFCLSVKSLWIPGGGGFSVTDDEKIAEAIVSRRYLGFPAGWGSTRTRSAVGLNYKMTDFGASIGRVQLKHLDEYVKMQRNNSKIYTNLLADAPIKTPIEKEYAYHAFLRYTIRCSQRDALQKFLKDQGVETSILYPEPEYLQPMYVQRFGYKKGDFPMTDKQKSEELSLPEPRARTQTELEYVSKKIREFYKS